MMSKEHDRSVTGDQERPECGNCGWGGIGASREKFGLDIERAVFMSECDGRNLGMFRTDLFTPADVLCCLL